MGVHVTFDRLQHHTRPTILCRSGLMLVPSGRFWQKLTQHQLLHAYREVVHSPFSAVTISLRQAAAGSSWSVPVHMPFLRVQSSRHNSTLRWRMED